MYVSKPTVAKEPAKPQPPPPYAPLAAIAPAAVVLKPPPKPVPLDEACAHLFDDAVRKSVEMIKQHYQRRYAGVPEKLQALAAEKEMEAAKIRRLEADKARLEDHLSAVGARATKAERMLDEASAAYDAEVQRRVGLEQTVANQQAMIDRLNYTIFNTSRARSRTPPPRFEVGAYRGR